MAISGRTPPASTATRSAAARRDPRVLVLNLIIGALALLVVLLAYAFIGRTVLSPPVDAVREGGAPGGAIQLDVLNGCGAPGAATSVTSFLRARGFDVVEMRNYKSFDVQESLVIDRNGNSANAAKVAYALGIRKQNIVRQINEEYFVDVSVIIGRDFPSLKPSQ
jgi:hypothetical protein